MVAELGRLGILERDHGGFLRIAGVDDTPVRVPTDDAATIRPVNQLPAEELDQAVFGIVSDSYSIGREELRLRVARLFGWARTGVGIENAIDNVTADLLDAGLLIEDAGYLRPSRP